jgi:hypothetical protein
MKKKTLSAVIVSALTLFAAAWSTSAVAGASTTSSAPTVPPAVSASSTSSSDSAAPAASSATKKCNTLDPKLWATSHTSPAFSKDVKQALADGCGAYVSTDVPQGQSSPSALYLEFIRGPVTGCSGPCVGAAPGIAYIYTSSGAPVEVTDLAITNTGVLYAVDYTSDFYKVNTTTGIATLIGPVNAFVNGLVVGPTGTVYASGNDALYAVNTSTGAGTLIGSNAFSSSGDLAFAHCGCLYMTASESPYDDLVLLNSSNGSATLVGSTGQTNVFGLISSYGTLFATTLGGYLLTINPGTGLATELSYTPGLPASGMTSPPNHT